MRNQEGMNIFRIFFQTVPVLLTFGIIIAFEGYDLYFAGFDLSFGYVGSFLVAILVCFFIQLFINRNPMLNNKKSGIVAGTILTIEIMLFLLFAQYHLFVTGMIVTAILLLTSLLTQKIICFNKKKRKITPKLKRWCRNRSHSLVAYILCFILIVPAGMGVYEEYYKDSLSSEEWAEFVSWFNESEESSKVNNEAIIPHSEKIADLSKWDSLDIKDKERLIRTVALIEKENLGINKDTEVVVLTKKMSTCTLGYYIDEKNEIYINYKHLNEGELSDVLNTVIHEMHHAFVYYTISTLDYESEEVKNNYYYQKAREWKENSENYISSNDGFDKYETQPIEADARAYAKERVALYENFIENTSENATPKKQITYGVLK